MKAYSSASNTESKARIRDITNIHAARNGESFRDSGGRAAWVDAVRKWGRATTGLPVVARGGSDELRVRQSDRRIVSNAHGDQAACDKFLRDGCTISIDGIHSDLRSRSKYLMRRNPGDLQVLRER